MVVVVVVTVVVVDELKRPNSLAKHVQYQGRALESLPRVPLSDHSPGGIGLMKGLISFGVGVTPWGGRANCGFGALRCVIFSFPRPDQPVTPVVSKPFSMAC